MKPGQPLLFLVLLLLASLLSSSALAGTPTTFYNGWVYPGETFTVNGSLFALSSSSTPAQVLLERGSDRYILNYNDCVVTVDGLQKYCYTDSDYVRCERGNYTCPVSEGQPANWCCPMDVDHIRFEAGKAVYAAYLMFWNEVPVLDIVRTPEKTTMMLSETSDVTLTFTNNGDDSIVGATYNEIVPPGFAFTWYAPDFLRTGNVLSLTFNLAPGATHMYRYTVTPSDYVSGDFTGNLTYVYKGAAETIVPTTFTIAVPSPFTITHTLNPASVIIGSSAAYTYTLQNNDGQYDMDATIRFTGFPALNPTTRLPSGVTLENGVYLWRGTLKKGETVSFAFSFTPTRTGSYPITANTTMTLNGATFEHPVQDTLTATATPLKPDIRFDSPVTGGSAYSVRLFLLNTAGDTEFHDVAASFSASGLPSASYAVNTIPPGSAALLAELNLTAPSVAQDAIINFTLNGTYRTPYDEQFNYSERATLTVKPSHLPYLITTTVNATNVTPGASLAVTVDVQSQQATYRTVSITDVLPSAALVTAGFRQIELSLNAGEKREAYKYQVTVPESYDSTLFTISSQVYDQQSGERTVKNTTVTVYQPLKPVHPANAANATNGNETSQQKGVQKKGFFQTIADAISSFFAWIFG
jgi:hypothetical protein